VPILLANEKTGRQVRRTSFLEKDVATYDGVMVKIDAWLGKKAAQVQETSTSP